MIFTVWELIDMLIMTAFVGFIFKDVFYRKPSADYDPLKFYQKHDGFENFKFAIAVTAPALILHELSHKFIAMSFGMAATFKAAYTFLGLGAILKMLNSGFIFFVPAYVEITGSGTALHFAIIAFAGPFANLLFWQASKFALKKNYIPHRHVQLAFLTMRINMFLFLFNMLPIPGFDGFKVYSNLFAYLF